jgi:hypothetical protein
VLAQLVPEAALADAEQARGARLHLSCLVEPGAIGYLAMEDASGACRIVFVLEP